MGPGERLVDEAPLVLPLNPEQFTLENSQMTRTRLLALLSILTCASTISAHAQTPVAFIGGNITYQWQSSGVFGGSPAYKWEGYGFRLQGGPGICQETGPALVALQGIIASGQRPVIHLLAGSDEAASTDDANPPSDVLEGFEKCFVEFMTTAHNAGLKVVVGTSPFSLFNTVEPFNRFIFAYCVPRGIPVIDYYTLLHRANDNFEGTQYWIPGSATSAYSSITNKGYAIMNGQADRVISQYVGGVKLKSGYLGNEAVQMNSASPFIPQSGVNTVAPSTKMHWFATGQYSDGYSAAIANANVQHEYGNWTSSNPEVISIDQDGTAWALKPGTANIHFTTLSGATLNEWVMYVTHAEHN